MKNNKKVTIAARLRAKQKKKESIYQEAARLHRTSYHYVHSIAAGYRIPVRGKGLEIFKWLSEKANDQ